MKVTVYPKHGEPFTVWSAVVKSTSPELGGSPPESPPRTFPTLWINSEAVVAVMFEDIVKP